MRVRLPLALTALAATSAPLAAQESPRDVAASFFRAVAEERWRGAAGHLDLAAFDRYRRERIAAERLPQPPRRTITADDLLRQDPDMPRAVAEYQARRMSEATGRALTWVDHEFADVPTVDSLAALSAEESAARWLQARDPRWTARRNAQVQRERGCPVPLELGRSFPPPVHEIVASVVADSATAYVLHRDATLRRRAEPDLDASIHSEGPLVMTLRRRNGRWQILPRDATSHGFTHVVGFFDDCPRANRPPR
ncbi:MAG: hypothetical protein ABR499_21845 [Gemmatimonadaceae bacterium]